MGPVPDGYLDIAPEVSAALQEGQAVVALESTIISHGMPYPENVETALRVERAVRDGGAVPATIAILGGRLKAGLGGDEISQLGERGRAVAKTSRRDIPFIVSRGEDGATTVAASMIVAEMAGIGVFATGGIGGVHRGFNETLDVSADLEELARTDVVVVCAGVKSVLDIGRTLEYLETKGVAVVGYRSDNLPAFYTPSSGYPVDYRAETPADIAAALQAKRALGLSGGMVVANPIPARHALDGAEIEAVIGDSIAEMKRRGIGGKDATPFLLAKVAESTEGRSLRANIELVVSNARLAAEIARAL
jgi:pseudouridine-5'-phosphate glycosidase